MPLSVGTRLWHYDVTALIGEGGMGQVWRATDTQLNRQVALKILPDAFAADPERLARFKREAQILASLNHPNIAAIYGIEESEGTRALVLELVEGPTLADRITKGPIPLDEALPIAKQIADALEAAHERGVIHRDLKPANVKVKDDGTVKVLDFGLEKALDPAPAGDPSDSPTLTAAPTQMGVIMGTAAYMAPEQAKGRPVDKRADIWAFGCVLFEMLTGTRVFAAGDVSDTLAFVLTKDIDWAMLPAEMPVALRDLLRRCLERDPKHRLRDIGDARFELEDRQASLMSEPTERVVATVPQLQLWQRPVPAVIVVLLVAVITGLAVWSLVRPGPPASPPTNPFAITLPASAPLANSAGWDLTLSSDGRTLVYIGRGEGATTQLYRRSMDQLEVSPIPGTEGASNPFLSPDGQWVGFLSFLSGGTSLKKVSLAGGPPLTICECLGDRGATWGPDDAIVFGGVNIGLFRVSATGGVPEALTTLASEGESHMAPRFLPGGRAVLFQIVPASGNPQLAVYAFDRGEHTVLGDVDLSPNSSGFSSGHIMFSRGDSLWAVPFHVGRLELTGDPILVLEGVARSPRYNIAQFDVAPNGSLVYVPGGAAGVVERTLVWVDREGREEPIQAPRRTYTKARVSPDGTRVALDIGDQEQDIWVWNVPDGPLTRLTFDGALDRNGHWTPDGDRVVFSSLRNGSPDVYWKAADGTGAAERLTESDNAQWVNAVTPDGTRLVATEVVPDRAQDLIVVTLVGDHATEKLVSTQFNERNAAIFPDGVWVAFESNESGQYEVYVRPFPDVESGRWQISTAGGRYPIWSPDGGEVFFLQGTQLMAAPVQTAASFTYGTSDVLFEAPYFFGFGGRNYDVAPDGRFLMMKHGGQANGDVPPPQINVVLNWFEELERLVPVD